MQHSIRSYIQLHGNYPEIVLRLCCNSAARINCYAIAMQSRSNRHAITAKLQSNRRAIAMQSSSNQSENAAMQLTYNCHAIAAKK
jgi:hypothetical protein